MEEKEVYNEKGTFSEKEDILFEQSLPNSGLVLTLGILSIPFCCCLPISLPVGIIGWVLGNKGVAEYRKNPGNYTKSSYSNLNAGRVLAIVGVVLTVLNLAWGIYNIVQMGGWDVYKEQIEEALRQQNY